MLVTGHWKCISYLYIILVHKWGLFQLVWLSSISMPRICAPIITASCRTVEKMLIETIRYWIDILSTCEYILLRPQIRISTSRVFCRWCWCFSYCVQHIICENWVHIIFRHLLMNYIRRPCSKPNHLYEYCIRYYWATYFAYSILLFREYIKFVEYCAE